MILGASAGLFPQADGGELDHHARAPSARHRLRTLQQFPGLAPVVACVTREGENNTTVHRVVYGDRTGDPDLLRSYSNDEPR